MRNKPAPWSSLPCPYDRHITNSAPTFLKSISHYTLIAPTFYRREP